VNYMHRYKGRIRSRIAVNETSYGCHLPCGITVLPATRYKCTHPALTSARQAGTRLTYPEGMEGWRPSPLVYITFTLHSDLFSAIIES